MSKGRPLVLFLCTGNSCRSQMAEALLRHRAGDRFEAASAGLSPAPRVHPMTIRVLEQAGVDTAGLTPKSIDRFLGKQSVAHAITVCARAQQSCPRVYPFALHAEHWPFDDPAEFEGSEQARLEVFLQTRDLIDERIEQWLGELVETP